LGASYGGDNGSALLTSVAEDKLPAAHAVNTGARRGLLLMSRAGQKNNSELADKMIARVARFGTTMWRTINGELGGKELNRSMIPGVTTFVDGVCAYDCQLRCSLLALWQLIWPVSCWAVQRVQTWKEHEGTQRYKDLGAHKVMKITEGEKVASTSEDAICNDLKEIVKGEIEKQKRRGDMAKNSYNYNKDKANNDSGKTSQGLGQPLAIVAKNNVWRVGGWTASTAEQRRSTGADGGTAIKKLRLMPVKGGD